MVLMRQLKLPYKKPLLNIIYDTLIKMGINIELHNNDFEINGKKFLGEVFHLFPDNRVFSEIIMTFDYDDEVFKHLPEKYYKRNYIKGREKVEIGITGVKNEYPDFCINLFFENILKEMKYK
jgi:lipoate-protein ligase A